MQAPEITRQSRECPASDTSSRWNGRNWINCLLKIERSLTLLYGSSTIKGESVGISAEVTERLRAWGKDVSPSCPGRLEKQFVHKHDPDNVFIARVERFSEACPDDLVAQLTLDQKHPYHFEHPQDHVPGMMLMEAGRQLALAVAHLFYDVPLDTVFILKHVTASFQRFAELEEPVFVYSWVREKEYRRNRLVSMRYEGEFIQGNEILGTMSGQWTMHDRRLMERVRRRGAQPDWPAALGSAQPSAPLE